MVICERDGYCISVEIYHDDKIEFSYYKLGKREGYFVAAANKYEHTVTIAKSNHRKFLKALGGEVPKAVEDKFEVITSKFNQVDDFEEIKAFLKNHSIPFKITKWVEFYD